MYSREDPRILEVSLKVMSLALDNLVAACLDENGKPKAPDRKALMQAQAKLPAYCSHTLAPKPKQP